MVGFIICFEFKEKDEFWILVTRGTPRTSEDQVNSLWADPQEVLLSIPRPMGDRSN